MNRADRAKQFMPFASLKGYYELILQQETFSQPRRELSEDECSELSEALKRIERGMTLSVVHYLHGEYVTTFGEVTKLDLVYRSMLIGERRIWFDDIISVREVTDFAEKNRLDIASSFNFPV